jgi:hypothetical protein
MKNFYSNRNFNFIKVFTKDSDMDYKRRFNQDIFNNRLFDPLIHEPPRPNKSRDYHRTTMLQSLKAQNEELVNSHFAWLDSDIKVRRIQKVKRQEE